MNLIVLFSHEKYMRMDKIYEIYFLVILHYFLITFLAYEDLNYYINICAVMFNIHTYTKSSDLRYL